MVILVLVSTSNSVDNQVYHRTGLHVLLFNIMFDTK